jgi:ABC-type multidrug transport system permease subunit
MIRAIFLTLGKEFRLIGRDRVGLFMLLVAPIAVIAAAGFSLANVYGGQTSSTIKSEIAFFDGDQGAVGRAIHDALADSKSVELIVAASRDDAEADVRQRKEAVLAVIVPAGTTESLRRGENPKLLVYTDPVKYLQSARIELMLAELARSISAGASHDARARFTAESAELRDQLEHARTAAAEARAEAEKLSAGSKEERDKMAAHLRTEVNDAMADARAFVSASLNAALRRLQGEIDNDEAQQRAKVGELKTYFTQLGEAQTQFRDWLAKLKELAGRHANDVPPPPAIPEPPSDLAAFNPPSIDVSTYRAQFERAINLPPPHIELPPMPKIPTIPIPEIPHVGLADASIPGALGYTEIDLGGKEIGSVGGFNAFDLQVPGFAVTFLLIGMLMGVSLALLDERDWGTLERLRSVAAPISATLAGKLFARFVVGFVQMVVLFAAGWVLFGISLGRAPAALMLPAAAIAFAGAAFGLVVAGVGRTRDAVLPVGAIVIMTMAAIGGCWWPIDFEPAWMRQVALGLPTTWAMQAFNDLMIRQLPAASALVPSGIDFGFGMLYLIAGVAIARRRFAT